jgi:hypothetical protein
MSSLSSKTIASSYADLLHVNNSGLGVSSSEHKPIYDGIGQEVGISVGNNMVSLNCNGGVLSNGTFTSKVYRSASSQIVSSSSFSINMNSTSGVLLDFVTAGSTITITFDLSIPSISLQPTDYIFAETRVVFKADSSASIVLRNSSGVTFHTVAYIFDPLNPFIHFRVFGFRGISPSASATFTVTETSEFTG